MESIKDKYARLRPLLRGGDIILFEGVKPVSNIIRFSDNCKYTHVGVVLEAYGSLFIIDSNRDGVQPARLSERIEQYSKGGNFIVKRALKGQDQINIEVSRLLKKTDRVIKYDFKNGTKSLINRLIGTKLKIDSDADRMICSEFVKPYAIALKMIHSVSLGDSLFFPQDFLRYEYYTETIF
jgi:hypothetical protein